jgi:hypothetical protein
LTIALETTLRRSKEKNVTRYSLANYCGIDTWTDKRIREGARWRDEIRHALQQARVAVLLITANYLASEFIKNDELQPLLEAADAGGTTIIPLIISPSLFEETPLSKFQAIGDPEFPLLRKSKGVQEATLTDLAMRVKRIVEASASPSAGVASDAPRFGAAKDGGTRHRYARRVFVSTPPDMWLSKRIISVKTAVLNAVAAAGFQAVSPDPMVSEHKWGVAYIDELLQSCHGVVLCAFARWRFADQREGYPVNLASEFTQIEGALASNRSLPVLLFIESGVARRGVFGYDSDLPAIEVSDLLTPEWLTTGYVRGWFEEWCEQVKARDDVYVGYTGNASSLGRSVIDFLQSTGASIAPTVIDESTTIPRSLQERTDAALGQTTSAMFVSAIETALAWTTPARCISCCLNWEPLRVQKEAKGHSLYVTDPSHSSTYQSSGPLRLSTALKKAKNSVDDLIPSSSCASEICTSVWTEMTHASSDAMRST